MHRNAERVQKITSLAAGIVACALLGATEAGADPYVVTLTPEGSNIVAASNAGGEINSIGLTSTFVQMPGAVEPAILWPNTGRIETGAGAVEVLSLLEGTFSGPRTFGTAGRVDPIPGSASGSPVGISLTAPQNGIFNDQVNVPLNYVSGQPLAISTAMFPGTFASLGISPGATFTWTWGGAPDQSFTIHAVPGPIVGAGLPGLIAALGGLVAIARRRRKQLA